MYVLSLCVDVSVYTIYSCLVGGLSTVTLSYIYLLNNHTIPHKCDSIYLCIYLSIYLPIFLSICLSFYLSLYTLYSPVYPPVCLLIPESVQTRARSYQCPSVSVCPSVLYIDRAIYLLRQSIKMSVSLSVCPFVCLSFC